MHHTGTHVDLQHSHTLARSEHYTTFISNQVNKIQTSATSRQKSQNLSTKHQATPTIRFHLFRLTLAMMDLPVTRSVLSPSIPAFSNTQRTRVTFDRDPPLHLRHLITKTDTRNVLHPHQHCPTAA